MIYSIESAITIKILKDTGTISNSQGDGVAQWLACPPRIREDEGSIPVADCSLSSLNQSTDCPPSRHAVLQVGRLYHKGGSDGV